MSNTHAQDDLTCADFKEGNFVIHATDEVPFETQIMRRGNQQTEIVEINGETLEAVVNIKWIDDCSYTLVFDENIKPQGDFITEEALTSTLVTTILKIKGNCADFKVSGIEKGRPITMYATLCKQELL